MTDQLLDGVDAAVTGRPATDFYLLDDLLADDERVIRDKVRAFADGEILPIINDYHVARHMTDMEVVDTYEGTDTIQSLIVGRDVTGISAFA